MALVDTFLIGAAHSSRDWTKMEGHRVKEILTIKDVVEMTDGVISEATLRWYRATGQGGPRSGSLGRRVVYRRSDVEAWIASAFEDGAA